MRSFWTQLNTEVTEETPISVVGAAVMWIVIIWRSWGAGEWRLGVTSKGMGSAARVVVDMVRESSWQPRVLGS